MGRVRQSRVVYDGMRGPVRVSRGRVVAAAVVALVVLGGSAVLWFSNTSTIHVLDAGRTLSGSPGDTLSVDVPVEDCTPPIITFQRKGLFGRWQQTHVGQDRDVVPWYHVGSRTLDSPMPCLTGHTITIPADVTWSPVAACSADMECFVIDVVSADGDGGAGG